MELNRALHQVHKLSTDGKGGPLQWWPIVEEWEEAKRQARIKKEEWSIPLKIKKEKPPSPKIKVEEPPSPQLLYPSQPSRYTSVDPNTFDWGDNAMVD